MGDECMHCQISISPAAFYNVLSSCYVAPAPTSEIMVHANSVMFILKIEVSDTSVLARLYLSAIPGRGVLKCLCAKYNCTTCPHKFLAKLHLLSHGILLNNQGSTFQDILCKAVQCTGKMGFSAGK